MYSSSNEQNFTVLIEALRFTNRGLKDYVDFCLEDIYNSILQNVAIVLPPCNTYCNNLPENQWCAYCKKWRAEIERYVRLTSFKNKIKWQDVDFGKLTGAERDLAKTELFSVYVRRNQNSQVDFDIQTILSLFQNCVYFDIGKKKTILDSVRTIRNKHFAHTVNFNITNQSLTKSIDKLIFLFRDPSIQNYGDTKSIIAKLKTLRNENTCMALVETSTRELCRQVMELRYDTGPTIQRKIYTYLLSPPTGTGAIRPIRGQCSYVPVFILLMSAILACWLKNGTSMKGKFIGVYCSGTYIFQQLFF
jgi:hypothetical protein